MSIKTYRFEITSFAGGYEARQRWHSLADTCREMINTVWRLWEGWHTNQEHDLLVQQFADNLRAYRRKEIDVKPKLDVKCMPNELSKLIYKQLTVRFPRVHTRVISILLNIIRQTMTNKDVEGRWSVWQAVLMNRQSRPSVTKDAPIPFDSLNAQLLKEDGQAKIAVRIERTKGQSKLCKPIKDIANLKVKGKSHVIFSRLLDGTYKFCGSQLVYQKSKKKWFALIAFKDETTPPPDLSSAPPKPATLFPSREDPWVLFCGEHQRYFSGRGGHIASARTRLLTQRWSRQENYRYAGSSNKGRGRKRAMMAVEKLSQRWKDFTKTCNHTTTKHVLDWCVENAVTHLIYMQPEGGRRNGRFLATAGKVPGRHDSTNWDWTQVATFLAYKCNDLGIELEVRKYGDKKKNHDTTMSDVRDSRTSDTKGSRQPKAEMVS